MRMSKYRQVTEWIQNRIASGELNRGDQIESENDISRVFGISRQTVRHALGLLEQQGVLTGFREAEHTLVTRKQWRKKKNFPIQ